jgi:hypothetical protein
MTTFVTTFKKCGWLPQQHGLTVSAAVTSSHSYAKTSADMSLLPCSAASQWLFVLEGFPNVVMGVVVYFALPGSLKQQPR